MKYSITSPKREENRKMKENVITMNQSPNQRHIRGFDLIARKIVNNER